MQGQAVKGGSFPYSINRISFVIQLNVLLKTQFNFF
jgi:hypothetical protein